jgi:hypothetical protein
LLQLFQQQQQKGGGSMATYKTVAYKYNTSSSNTSQPSEFHMGQLSSYWFVWLRNIGYADANRHALLNTRKLPVYSTCRLCQQIQTLNLLVMVQGQCTMGCAADESGMEGVFSAP